MKDADPGITGTLDHNLALVGSEQGEFEEARRLFESAQRIWAMAATSRQTARDEIAGRRLLSSTYATEERE